MLRQLLFLVFVAASTVFCAPTSTQVTDTDVLQFALTLEHLEDAFYSSGLFQYDAKAFQDAGFPEWVRRRFAQVGEHEAEHVKFLNGALGAQATKPCEYSFPHNNPQEFVTLSLALESVGDAAYTGAAQLVSDKGILTAAASILSVEARHSAWISSAGLKYQPWNGAFDAPLTSSGAFSLASLFVKNCPSSNPALPVKSFPALTLSNPTPSVGASVSFRFDGSTRVSTAYVAWLQGLGVVYSDLDANWKTTVPSGLKGTTFATVVNDKNAAPNDANMLSGFAIVQFPFDSQSM
ncbi:ferritin-like domain-containing protein [Trametes maxima]|nr:ferritin-like domain-containing protein [Trametes maxima]